MYNIKKQNNDVALLILGIIFTIIGLVGLIVILSIFFFPSYYYDSHTKVVSYEWHYDNYANTPYRPVITFTYANDTYTCNPNYHSSDKHRITKVYFNKNNPKDCMVDFSNIVGDVIYAFFIFPSVFLFLGLLFIIMSINRKRKIKLLKYNGVLVKDIPCTITNLNTTVNGKRYVQITANYTFPDGSVRKLKRMVLADKKQISEQKCDLLYLLEDYKIYYIDFDIEYETYKF